MTLCDRRQTEDEFVLVRLSQRELPRCQSSQQSAGYDLALVVSRDLSPPAADARLRLRFYVLMTSRRYGAGRLELRPAGMF